MNGIKQRRIALGLDQKDLAELLDCDNSTVCKWETGAALPQASKLPALAAALHCTIDDLFEKGYINDSETR